MRGNQFVLYDPEDEEDRIMARLFKEKCILNNRPILPDEPNTGLVDADPPALGSNEEPSRRSSSLIAEAGGER